MLLHYIHQVTDELLRSCVGLNFSSRFQKLDAVTFQNYFPTCILTLQYFCYKIYICKIGENSFIEVELSLKLFLS